MVRRTISTSSWMRWMSWRYETMDPIVIREAVRAQPFQPFILRLADGREFNVQHPEFLAVGANGRTVVFVHPEDGRVAIVNALLIISLERAAPAPPAPGNGSTAS